MQRSYPLYYNLNSEKYSKWINPEYEGRVHTNIEVPDCDSTAKNELVFFSEIGTKPYFRLQ